MQNTSFANAKFVAQSLLTLREAFEFKEYVEQWRFFRMGAINVPKPEHNEHFNIIAGKMKGVVFTAIRGRYSWETDLFDYLFSFVFPDVEKIESWFA